MAFPAENIYAQRGDTDPGVADAQQWLSLASKVKQIAPLAAGVWTFVQNLDEPLSPIGDLSARYL